MVAGLTRYSCIGLITAVFFISLAVLAQAQDRVALVIGNSNYTTITSLDNPGNDAVDIAGSLERIGFDVTVETDLNALGMNRALAQFARAAQGADQAILYFAGHGVEIDNRNYLIPTDARIRDSLDVTFQSVELEKLLKTVEGAKSLRLVMLDACRDNPFPFQLAGATRSLGRGLARIEPPGGVLVSYAARGGTVAYDGEGRNSPYAAAILDNIEKPGLEIGKLFRRIRDDVFQRTGGLQEPFTYGSLPAEDIYLAGVAGPTIFDAFAAAQSANTPEAWDLFLQNHSNVVGHDGLMAAARQLRAVSAGISPATQAAPEPVENLTPQETEEALKLTQSAKRGIQERLSDLGFPSGRPDGVFGRRTRAAIEGFQEEFQLEPTGYVSPGMVRIMNREWETAPPNLDGLWQVTVIRLDQSGRSAGGFRFKQRRDLAAMLQLRITGRNIELLKFNDLTKRPSSFEPRMSATLSNSGRADLVLTLNYEHFRNQSRRTSLSTDLPLRFSYTRKFEGRPSTSAWGYRMIASWRRLKSVEDGFYGSAN